MTEKKRNKMSWIKTEDKLPKDGDFCWINISPDFIAFGWYEGTHGTWSWQDSGRLWNTEEVTHWQPFYSPDPPKGEKQ